MDLDFRIDGARDFDDAVEKLGARKARSVLSRALNQSTQPVVSEARRMADANVGRQSGEGRKNIKKRTLKKGERNALGLDLASMVYLDERGFHLRFWELGFTRDGQHFAARPWLRPAADSQQGAVIRRFGQRATAILRRELEKKAQK